MEKGIERDGEERDCGSKREAAIDFTTNIRIMIPERSSRLSPSK